MVKEIAVPTWYSTLLEQIAECDEPNAALRLFIAGVAVQLDTAAGNPIACAITVRELLAVLNRLGGLFAATILDAGTVDSAHDPHDVVLPTPHRVRT